MRKITLALCCLFLYFGIAAQSTVLVLRTSGQVQYYAYDGAKPVVLSPGMELALQGRLQCKGAGTAKLICNGSTFMVAGSNAVSIQELVKPATKANQMTFAGRFFTFLVESIKGGDSQRDLEKHHQRYMGKVSGGIKGWGQQTYAIKPSLLVTGKLPQANVAFTWHKTAGQGPYTFQLRAENGTLIAQVLTIDSILTLDLDQLALHLGEEYSWQVSRGENAKSTAIPFELSNASVKDRQAALAKEPAFQSAEPMEQQLMLAYQLEQEKCFYNANQLYQQLISAEPDNVLLNKMYATFLARLDMLGEAQTLLFAPH